MKNKLRSLIVAYCLDTNVIGKDGGIPWHLLKDMNFFRNITTMAGICIMGRKNYESLPDGYRPLPHRKSIILTRQPFWQPKEESDDIFVEHDHWNALNLAESLPGKEICYIGGADIYKWAMENVVLHKIYRTLVIAPEIKGDTFFPADKLPNLKDNYNKVSEETFFKNEKHTHNFIIEVWEKK